MTTKEQIEAIREKDVRLRSENPEVFDIKYRIENVPIEDFLGLVDQYELRIFEGYDCGYIYLPLGKDVLSSSIQFISVPAKFKTETKTTFETVG